MKNPDSCEMSDLLCEMQLDERCEKDRQTRSLGGNLQQEITILRKELQNVRIKMSTMDRIHHKFVADIQSQLNSSFNTDIMKMHPIGFLESPFSCKNATPRQSSLCEEAKSKLKLLTKVLNNPKHALEGLEPFSHVWLIFVFHQNQQGCFKKGKVAPPRLNGKKMGVYATRSPHRVNPIGLSLVKLDKIQGDTLHFSGVDMIDGTPILDIKPYIPSYDKPSKMLTAKKEHSDEAEKTTAEVSVAEWVKSPEIGHLSVRFTPTAEKQISYLISTNEELSVRYPNAISVQSILTTILREDPRSIYRKTRCQQLLYFFNYDAFHLTCWVDEQDKTIEVVKVEPTKTEKVS